MTYQGMAKLTSPMQSLQSNHVLKKVNEYIKSRGEGTSKEKCLKNFNQHEFTQVFDNKYLFELLDGVSKLEASAIINSMTTALRYINSVYLQHMEAVAQRAIEEAKNGMQSAKEAWKNALRIMREVEERRSQNVKALTRV